jgi:hypothetical protein
LIVIEAGPFSGEERREQRFGCRVIAISDSERATGVIPSKAFT